MKFRLTLWISKLAKIAIKIIAPSRGTDFPGKLAYLFHKNFIKGFRNIDLDHVFFVTGTNGKSTITNLLYHTLSHTGKKVIANLSGSNMLNGAASVLIDASDWIGNISADVIIIEVDERSFPYIIDQLPGKNILITNIMQDQVHRNGDPDFIYQLLRKHMPEGITMFLNNDEPRSKSYEDLAGDVFYFGVDQNDMTHSTSKQDITMPCPYCFERIVFDYENSANLGQFHCSVCEFRSSETALTQADSIDFKAKQFQIRGTTHPMPYDSPIMLYNYAAVSAVSAYLGIDDTTVAESLHNFTNVEGRMDILDYKGKQIKYLRIKQGNPETVQMAIDTIRLDKTPKAVAFGLCIIPERRPQWVPHYTNTYYAYESDFTPLNNNDTKMLVFSDYIALDQLNRLRYDGFDETNIKLVESEDPRTVLDALYEMEEDNMYLIAPIRNIKLFKIFLERVG